MAHVTPNYRGQLVASGNSHNSKLMSTTLQRFTMPGFSNTIDTCNVYTVFVPGSGSFFSTDFVSPTTHTIVVLGDNDIDSVAQRIKDLGGVNVHGDGVQVTFVGTMDKSACYLFDNEHCKPVVSGELPTDEDKRITWFCSFSDIKEKLEGRETNVGFCTVVYPGADKAFDCFHPSVVVYQKAHGGAVYNLINKNGGVHLFYGEANPDGGTCMVAAEETTVEELLNALDENYIPEECEHMLVRPGETLYVARFHSEEHFCYGSVYGVDKNKVCEEVDTTKRNLEDDDCFEQMKEYTYQQLVQMLQENNTKIL